MVDEGNDGMASIIPDLCSFNVSVEEIGFVLVFVKGDAYGFQRSGRNFPLVDHAYTHTHTCNCIT